MTDRKPDDTQPPVRSADVIPFPRRPPEPVAAPADEGQERLRKALATLETALAGQRAAVAEWRRSLSDLQTTMSGLGASMRRYDGSLQQLDGRVSGLHNQALELERTADMAIAAATPGSQSI